MGARSRTGIQNHSADKSRRHWQHLQEQLAAKSYLVDDLVRADVAFLADDAAYFVFQPQLEELLLAFTRDSEVRGRLQQNARVLLETRDPSGYVCMRRGETGGGCRRAISHLAAPCSSGRFAGVCFGWQRNDAPGG